MMPMRGWMLSLLVALVLWPAVAYGQSPELKDAFALYKKLNAQGRYQEALPFAEITLRWSRREFGPDHPQVATSLENYAALLRKSGRTTEAAKKEARAKVIRGTPKFEPIHVTLADQFEGKLYVVRKPTELCVPVDKEDEGIKNEANHLMCYRIRRAPVDSMDKLPPLRWCIFTPPKWRTFTPSLTVRYLN